MIKSENFESMNGGNVYCNVCIDTFYSLLELNINPSVALFVASLDEEQRQEMVERIKQHKEELENA